MMSKSKRTEIIMAKTNRESNRSQIADLAWQIADHQARIQTIAANWGEEITEQLNATEKAFLAKLAKELKNFKFNTNAKETLDRLKKITDKLNSIRQAAYQRAEEKVKAEARKLAENETKWGKRITKELSEPGTKLKDATPTLLDKVVKFGLADGKTLQEYFTGIADADAVRIESSLRQGVESGWTIDQLARNIAGSAENNYKDGIFETSRKSAVNMARTLCNAVSNNAKDAFYNANSDVIDGVEILATLDGRTCMARGQRILTPDGLRPIEQIKMGDKVIGGSREVRNVLETSKKRVKKTLRITLANGETIRCTPDHLFFLESGQWREAGDLREGDEIAEHL